MTAPVLSAVRLQRSGGIAGLQLAAAPRVANLSPAQHRALLALLPAPGAHPAPAGPMRGADRFVYRVQLTLADGQQHQLTLPEDAWPDVLSPLLQPAD